MPRYKDDHPSPFRDLWTALGKLREVPAVDADPEACERWQHVAEAVSKAEREWAGLARGPGEN
jgi:hypothetical protein